jgi:hypothetical protein
MSDQQSQFEVLCRSREQLLSAHRSVRVDAATALADLAFDSKYPKIQQAAADALEARYTLLSIVTPADTSEAFDAAS